MIEQLVEEVMDGKKWVRSTRGPFTGEGVYKALASDMAARYLKKAPYIKSVRRVQKYTHLEIIVTYTHGVRARYILPAHF